MLFFVGSFFFFFGKRTCDFAFVSLCHGRSGEEICTGYMPWPLAAECNMITTTTTTIPDYDFPGWDFWTRGRLGPHISRVMGE